MVNEQKKKTAQTSSVGADDQRSISQKNNITIPDLDGKNNPAEDDFEEFYRQIQRMQDPAYLHTVTLDELMEQVFQGKAAVVENLLYTGAYGGSFIICSGNYALREDSHGTQLYDTHYDGTTVAIRIKTDTRCDFETAREMLVNTGERESQHCETAVHSASKSSSGHYF